MYTVCIRSLIQEIQTLNIKKQLDKETAQILILVVAHTLIRASRSTYNRQSEMGAEFQRGFFTLGAKTLGCYLAGSLLITDASVKTLVIIWNCFAALSLLKQGERRMLEAASQSESWQVQISSNLVHTWPKKRKINRGKHPHSWIP